MNKKNLLLIFTILTAGILAYSNSFDCSFHFDDANVFDSKVTNDSATIIDWFRFSPSRPIGMLTFAANYNLHRLDVWGYHLVNLIIHLINALLVYWLARITLSSPVMKDESISKHKTVIAFLTGLLFVTHPLATQSVTYIAQRFALLATFFYLLSLSLFIRGSLWQGNRNISLLFFGTSIFSSICGMLTKEIVFTLPFAILLYDYFFLKATPWKLKMRDRSLVISFIMLVIFTLLIFRVRSLDMFNTVEPGQGYSYSISMKEYFFTQFRVILTYIRLFILPVNQNLDYHYPISTAFFHMKTFFSFLALLGIALTGIFLFKKYRLISFGIFWFFLTISVESSIIPISQNVIFEHRTYLPSFGFFIAFVGAFFYFFREKYLRIAIIALLFIVFVNTVLTYQRNRIWKDDYTLWADCLKKSPSKARVNNNLGLALLNQGKTEESIVLFSNAIRITPGYIVPYINRGLAYSKIERYQKAIDDYNKAIPMKSDVDEIYNNRGTVYDKLGQYQQAINDYKKAISLKPTQASAYNNKGIVYYKLGEYQQAFEDYNKALSLKKDYADTYINRGNLYDKLGQYKLATDDYSKAITYKPDHADAYNNRGKIYGNLGQYQLAIEDFNKAIRLKENYAEAYHNKGFTYYKMGQYQQAVADYNKAIHYKPEYADAYCNRAVIFFKQGHNLQGCLDAQKACALGNCKTFESAKNIRLCR